jgi:hypothetical protein
VSLSLLLLFVTSAIDGADCSTSRPGRFTSQEGTPVRIVQQTDTVRRVLVHMGASAVYQVTPAICLVITQTPRMLKLFPATVHVGFVVDGYAQTGFSFSVSDSAVSIATRYGWAVQGSNPGGWARFSAPVQTVPGAHPVSYTVGTGSFSGVKRLWRGVDHPPHLVSRLKKE